MKGSNVKQVAATADITTVSSHLKAVSLTGGSDAAVLTVRAGGAAGTVIGVIKAAIATTAPQLEFHDALCAGGIHATITGTAASATFIYA